MSETKRKSVRCPVCGHERTDKLDILAIKKNGECLACEHIKGDL